MSLGASPELAERATAGVPWRGEALVRRETGLVLFFPACFAGRCNRS